MLTRFAIIVAFVCLAAGLLRPAVSAERLTLVTPTDTVDTVISEVIVREAYRRIGIKVEIKKYPAERALRLADRGVADGEVQRIDGIAKTYTNLIKVTPPINFIEATVFSKSVRFRVDSWESLRPYRIGIIRGIKFAERHTAGMNSFTVKNYAILFHMLDNDRFDIVTSPRVNGLYNLKKLGIRGIDELRPSIMRFDLYHYLHRKHADLVPAVSTVFEEMRASGELERIRARVIAVLMRLAAQNLPLCDDDYACFDDPAD